MALFILVNEYICSFCKYSLKFVNPATINLVVACALKNKNGYIGSDIISMENEILDKPLALGKVYSLTQIYLATLFAGPLSGGYLIAQNFKTLGQPNTAGATIVLAIGVTILVVASAFIPALDAIPSVVFVAAYTFGLCRWAQAKQDDKIDEFTAAGGEIYTNGRVVLVSLIGLVLCIVLIVGAIIILDAAGLQVL